MRYCSTCDQILGGDAAVVERCPACGVDAPASGWPDDGVALPAGLERRALTHRLTLPSESRQRYALRHEAELVLWTPRRGGEAGGLIGMARAGLGGVLEAGESAEVAWVVLSTAGVPLAERWSDEGFSVNDALVSALAVLRALSAHRDAELPLEGLRPARVLLADASGEVRAWLRTAEAFAVVSGSEASSSGGSLGRWGSPQTQDGEAWTWADGVYTCGLMLYRMLSGAHPFSGLGLRERMRRQGAGEVAPMEDAVRDGLAPGLHALVLEMLAGPRERRPSLEALEAALASYAEGRLLQPRHLTEAEERSDAPESPEDPVEPEAEDAPPRAPAPIGAPASRRWASGLAFAVAALGVAALLWAAGGEAETSSGVSRGALAPGAATPMTARSRPEDCASCHPNHVMEWEHSVMAHAARSPLFNSLEMVVEEQIGRSNDCPNGAGALRRADPATACRDATTGLPITGSGGEHWCVNCHYPLERNLDSVPAWDAQRPGVSLTRSPVIDIVSDTVAEGITCTFCHQVTGPARASADQDGYLGNNTWRSFLTGTVFDSRPESRRGQPGIGNSGYYHDADVVFTGELHPESPAKVHGQPSEEAAAFLSSSEFCGTCHDVRIFGTDMIGRRRGEHFKRLRNAYSEWVAWRDDRRAQGEPVHSCQDCHMSLFPGVCEVGGEGGEEHGCPPGTGFVAKAPGSYAAGGASTVSEADSHRTVHYFTGVDVPMTPSFDERWSEEATLDIAGLPLGATERRDLLLKNTFRFEIGALTQRGSRLEVPVLIENAASGHKAPAGFSQEREIWVHLEVRDAEGRLVYEVGRVDSDTEDLRDKIFLAVGTDPDRLDAQGQPVGLFGANVADGPDVPQWTPPPERGGASRFRGEGLINFQNGFLRCVTCIGRIDARGQCQPLPGQERHRAARFADGDYDLDTGDCRSNLRGDNRFFEIYFPAGSLDADRGVIRGPDAIIDTRSLAPQVPQTYVYELDVRGFTPPFQATGTLNFRAFPPFLIRAFIDYEQRQAAKGLRPSGPLMDPSMLEKLEVVELERATRSTD